MKKGWDKYATEKRYIKKGYLRKYRNGNPSWKTPETGGCNCVQQSREEKEVNPGLSLNLQEIVAKDIEWYGKTVLLTEQVVPNEPFSPDEELALKIYEQSLRDVNDDTRRGRGNGSLGSDNEGRSDRDEESGESVVAVQDVSKKQTKRNRKTRSDKKRNDGLQKKQGE